MVLELATIFLPTFYISSISCLLGILLCKKKTEDKQNEKEYHKVLDDDIIVHFDSNKVDL